MYSKNGIMTRFDQIKAQLNQNLNPDQRRVMEDLATNTYVEEDQKDFDEVQEKTSSNVEENPCIQPFESHKQQVHSSIQSQAFFDHVNVFMHSEKNDG